MPYKEWIDKSEIQNLFSAGYWNSTEEEKEKAWYVSKPEEVGKLFSYIETNGYLKEYETATEWLCKNEQSRKRVLDVAAGVCWTSSLLSKDLDIDYIDAVDFSFHRIHDIAPNVIAGMGGIEEKITRIFGSFYELKSDEKYDVIFMSQAFHHASRPFHLLKACDEKLRCGGVILLLGEHNITPLRIVRRFLKKLIVGRGFTLDFYEMFPPDPVAGDHYYRKSDYRFIFGSMGYSLEVLRSADTMVMAAVKQCE